MRSLDNLPTKWKLTIGSAVPLAILMVLTAIGVGSMMRMQEASDWVAHTAKVVGEANSIVGNAVNMETGMRGFLLAGKDEFLEPYYGGSKEFTDRITKLQQTVSDNPPQVARLREAEQQISEWQANIVEPMIQKRREVGTTGTMNEMAALVAEGRGKQYFDGFRQIMTDFTAVEQNLMVSRQEENQASALAARSAMLIGLVFGFLVTGILAWLISKSIAGPLRRLSQAMHILTGDNTDIQLNDSDRKDEIGEMSRSVEVFRENAIERKALVTEQERNRKAQEERVEYIDALVAEFDRNSMTLLQDVSDAAIDMLSTADQMTRTAQESSQRTSTVANAAEEALSSVQNMASSTEEMTISIQEIAATVSKSTTIADKASQEARASTAVVSELATAAQEIGTVVSLINDIAEQTNLLALNATIEAARAGEAGKGFAVVASEVKSLASQTAGATFEISKKIEAIQGSSETTANSMNSIGEVIAEISELSTVIASAIEQQSAAAQEIAQGAQIAAGGTQDVTTNIAEVNEATETTQSSSQRVQEMSKQLSKHADSLKSECEKFLNGVKAA